MSSSQLLCYWKGIANTTSKEGLKFREQYVIDYDYCRDQCVGAKGYNECENFISIEEMRRGPNTNQYFEKLRRPNK
jgi:hypothetical protein